MDAATLPKRIEVLFNVYYEAFTFGLGKKAFSVPVFGAC